MAAAGAVPGVVRSNPAGVPLSRTALVVDRLESEIRAGTWPRNSLLPPERVLCGTLGVSRPALREAIRILSSRGLLAVRHGVGARVIGETSLPVKEVYHRALLASRVAPTAAAVADVEAALAGGTEAAGAEAAAGGDAGAAGVAATGGAAGAHSAATAALMEARMLLEPAIAALAAARADDGDIARIQEVLDHFAAAMDDLPRLADLDLGFHQAVCAAARNPLFAVMLEPLGQLLSEDRLASLAQLSPEAALAKRMRAHLEATNEAFAKR